MSRGLKSARESTVRGFTLFLDLGLAEIRQMYQNMSMSVKGGVLESLSREVKKNIFFKSIFFTLRCDYLTLTSFLYNIVLLGAIPLCLSVTAMSSGMYPVDASLTSSTQPPLFTAGVWDRIMCLILQYYYKAVRVGVDRPWLVISHSTCPPLSPSSSSRGAATAAVTAAMLAHQLLQQLLLQ
jgi:hypothetical protein